MQNSKMRQREPEPHSKTATHTQKQCLSARSMRRARQNHSTEPQHARCCLPLRPGAACCSCCCLKSTVQAQLFMQSHVFPEGPMATLGQSLHTQHSLTAAAAALIRHLLLLLPLLRLTPSSPSSSLSSLQSCSSWSQEQAPFLQAHPPLGRSQKRPTGSMAAG